MDVAGNPKLISIKKFQGCAGQIRDKVDWLHRDRISAFEAFFKYLRRMHNNEKITENMIGGCDMNLEWASSLLVQLYRSIHHWKMDGKDIADITKLVKKLV